MSTWRDESHPALEREPRKVGDGIDRAAEAIGVPKAGVLGMLFSRWSELAGAEIASHTEPRSLRDGVLIVNVDQPAWAAQLRYLSSDLVAKIGALTGSSEVSEIQFRVSSADARSAHEK